MKTILVVDDMPAFREPIAACLQARGYTALEAGNGQEAMDLLQRQIPALILLDIGMPVMDGLAFLERMRVDPRLKEIPVILLTAIAEKDYVLRAAKLGMRDYLLKSRFSLKDLLARIEARLGCAPAPAASVAPLPSAGGTAVRAPARPAPAAPAQPSAASTPAAPTVPSASTLLAGLERIMERAEVEAQISECEQIAALSPAVTSVMKVTGRATCSVEDVARAIKQDQGLALKVLKLANSVVYTRGAAVASVDLAVSRIGMAQIRQMLMTIGVIEQFSGAGLSGRLNAAHFWEHSICCGLIAAELTRRLGGQETEVDAAFTMSLLHDAGRMVLAEQLGETYGRVMAAADSTGLPLEQVESRMLGANHAELMDLILSRWQFGQHISRPIASHHMSVSRLRSGASRFGRESIVLALADRLTHAMMVGCSGNPLLYPTQELSRHLGLKPADVDEVAQAAADQTCDIKCVLLSRSSSEPWPSWLAEMQRGVKQALNPLFVSTEAAGDAYGMAVSRLTEHCTGDRINLAVVHASSGKERAELAGLLRKSEQEAGVEQPLPLVLIAPESASRQDDALTAGRRVTHVPSPTPTRVLVAALNDALQPPAALAA